MTIRSERDGAVVVVTIDRPEARNALDPEHNAALAAALAEADADEQVRAIVLTGAGGNSFCAGIDLKTFLPPVRDRARAGGRPEWELGGITGARPRATPIIAAINGHALAGGLELALACDFRIASDNATLGLAETRWALIPGAGGTQRLPRAIPLGPALQMLLTGDPIDAQQAVTWGLINSIHSLEHLVADAVELAARIATRGPLAVQAARTLALESGGHGLDDGLQREYEVFLRILRSDDAVEGSTAFAEHREPKYNGR